MNELAKQLMCLRVRDGVEIWLEKERLENLIIYLEQLKENKFIKIDGRLVNSADVVGIFTPQDMEEVTRRRNGQWKDERGIWHDKGERVCGGCGEVIPIGKVCGRC